MTSPDEPDMTAAELALGVLDGEERAAALRRVLADPAFAGEVERWRRRFAGLYAGVPAVEPGATVGRRVAAIPDGNDARVRAWRAVAAFTGIAAAVLLAVVLVRPGPRPVGPATAHRAPVLVAVLAPHDRQPVAAVFDPATRTVTLRGAIETPADRAAELWAIGADGVPHAAALLGRAGARVAIRGGVAVGAGTTLAVSIEPPGGSPRPTPTGPVVASGTLAAI